MYYGGWRPYVSVAKRKLNGKKAMAKLIKKGEKIKPIEISGKNIANSFWGKAWCHHLESFSDFANRLPRGRNYVKNGSVLHLAIEEGKIFAYVQGSHLYYVSIKIKEVKKSHWNNIIENCSGSIGSIIELMQGKISQEVLKVITNQNEGLFPKPNEIELNCSCPDSAELCKHLAAALYGVGARLDKEPELLFKLRSVDHLELISKAKINTIDNTKNSINKSSVLEGQDLSDLFGIEIDEKLSTKNLNQPEKKLKKVLKTKKSVLSQSIKLSSNQEVKPSPKLRLKKIASKKIKIKSN